MDIDPMILQAWAARALEAEAEAAALRAQLDAAYRKAANLELELEKSERQRREVSNMADKMADKWTLQVERLRAQLDAARLNEWDTAPEGEHVMVTLRTVGWRVAGLWEWEDNGYWDVLGWQPLPAAPGDEEARP